MSSGREREVVKEEEREEQSERSEFIPTFLSFSLGEANALMTRERPSPSIASTLSVTVVLSDGRSMW